MPKLEDLNRLARDEVEVLFFRCCGSRAFANELTSRRPFTDREALIKAAENVWAHLLPGDWLEAFHQHPRIGDPATLRAKFGPATAWAKQEQAGVAQASEETLARLARLNNEYEARFGHVFLVCATGKTAQEMLAILEERLQNDRKRELVIAAVEQRKITQIRLEKLLDDE